MRSQKLVWVLPLVAASLGIGACAAPEGDGADQQGQDVTGGSGSIESPIVFMFDNAAATATPACAGAMLSDTMAVTAKACAKTGLFLGRAADKDGHGERAKITAVHLPEAADADIAVVELDKPLKGAIAVITHMPLRAGYAVNAFAAVAGKGLFAPEKNEASTVEATMTEETATHGSITPVKGAEICDGDMGAPVCSSTGGKLAGYNLFGTCGLSGLVVSRIASAAPAKAPDAKPAAAPPGADAKPIDPNAAKCSGGAWKVAQLGQHKDFLAKFAPKAFQPLFIDKPILRNFSYAPEGLWGYKTKGDVKACTLDAATLTAVAPGAPTTKLGAKVSFAGMDKKAAAWGRFGIAPKSATTNMRWLPAKPLDAATGAAFETNFEGIVSSETAGEYVVAFRASANGGESWTSCNTGGIDNGSFTDKTLALTVVDANTPSTPSTPPKTGDPTPSSQAPSDPAPTEGETSNANGNSDPLPDFTPTKKADGGKGNSGCSMTSSAMTSSPLSSSLPIAGVLLGLVALVRRRRPS